MYPVSDSCRDSSGNIPALRRCGNQQLQGVDITGVWCCKSLTTAKYAPLLSASCSSVLCCRGPRGREQAPGLAHEEHRGKEAHAARHRVRERTDQQGCRSADLLHVRDPSSARFEAPETKRTRPEFISSLSSVLHVGCFRMFGRVLADPRPPSRIPRIRFPNRCLDPLHQQQQQQQHFSTSAARKSRTNPYRA